MNEYPDAPHQDSLEVGAQFLDFVMEALQKRCVVLQAYTSKRKQYAAGESLQGWEVKLDNRFTDTGRLSIEIAEKTRRDAPAWTPSGIYRRDNTWIYIQGNFKYFFWFQKNILIGLHKSGRYEEAEHNGTVRKFYLPIVDAEKYGVKISPENYVAQMPMLEAARQLGGKIVAAEDAW
jgi:hypothetical protein